MLQRLIRSFHYAFRGIAIAVAGEQNMQIHLAAACAAAALGVIARLSPERWAAVVICCGLVMALEAVNTAIEAACDNMPTEQNSLKGTAKDVAAGAVLIAAIGSVIVAGFVFCTGEPWQNITAALTEKPVATVAVVILPALLILCLCRLIPKFRRK